jgi:hypothetical protein
MVDPSKIIRNDGTRIAVFSNHTNSKGGWEEVRGILGMLRDWRVVMLRECGYSAFRNLLDRGLARTGL